MIYYQTLCCKEQRQSEIHLLRLRQGHASLKGEGVSEQCGPLSGATGPCLFPRAFLLGPGFPPCRDFLPLDVVLSRAGVHCRQKSSPKKKAFLALTWLVLGEIGYRDADSITTGAGRQWLSAYRLCCRPSIAPQAPVSWWGYVGDRVWILADPSERSVRGKAGVGAACHQFGKFRDSLIKRHQPLTS